MVRFVKVLGVSYKGHMIGVLALEIMRQWAGMMDWHNQGIVPLKNTDSQIVEAIENHYDNGIEGFLLDYRLNVWSMP
jgi:hypothetical protein